MNDFYILTEKVKSYLLHVNFCRFIIIIIGLFSNLKYQIYFNFVIKWTVVYRLQLKFYFESMSNEDVSDKIKLIIKSVFSLYLNINF